MVRPSFQTVRIINDGDLFRLGCVGLGNGHRQHAVDQFGIHLVRIDVAGQADDPGELAGLAFTAVILDIFPFGSDRALTRDGQVPADGLNVERIGLDPRQLGPNIVVVRIFGEVDGRKDPGGRQASPGLPIRPWVNRSIWRDMRSNSANGCRQPIVG
jgi:hypothetical protein